MTRCFLILSVMSFGLVGCYQSKNAETQKDDKAASKTEPSSETILKNLMQKSLAEDFSPGKEIIVSYVEIPPNKKMDRHWHPGEEFQYYLEGRVEIAIDGQESIIGTPGTVGHVPFKKMHTAITGPEGAKLIVFRVHTAGEPVRYLEQGGASDR